jgi:hypothetical protein
MRPAWNSANQQQDQNNQQYGTQAHVLLLKVLPGKFIWLERIRWVPQ